MHSDTRLIVTSYAEPANINGHIKDSLFNDDYSRHQLLHEQGNPNYVDGFFESNPSSSQYQDINTKGSRNHGAAAPRSSQGFGQAPLAQRCGRRNRP